MIRVFRSPHRDRAAEYRYSTRNKGIRVSCYWLHSSPVTWSEHTSKFIALSFVRVILILSPNRRLSTSGNYTALFRNRRVSALDYLGRLYGHAVSTLTQAVQ
jgi:hypothetical protein